MITANELLRPTEGILNNYKSFYKYSTQEEYHNNKTFYQIQFYVTMNTLVHVLENRKYGKYSNEKEGLKKLLIEFSSIYFDVFQLDGWNDKSWQLAIQHHNNNSENYTYPQFDFLNSDELQNKPLPIKFIDYGFVFIEPLEFSLSKFSEIYEDLFNEKIQISHSLKHTFTTIEIREKPIAELTDSDENIQIKKLVNEYYNSLTDESSHTKITENQERLKVQNLFNVAIIFGRKDKGFYSICKEKQYKGTAGKEYNSSKLAKELFKETEYLIKVGTGILGYTLNNNLLEKEVKIKTEGNKNKHIFYQLKHDKDFNIVFFNHVKENNIDLHTTFIEKLEKFNIKNLQIQ